MMKNYKNENRKILLLASNQDGLYFMEDALVSVKSDLEDRIVKKVDCKKALEELGKSNFPIIFICPQEEDDECLAKYLYHLFLKDSKNHGVKVVLEGRFSFDVLPKKEIIFDCKKRLVRIRRKNLKSIVNTLFDVPPVYISYGNDESAKTLLQEIVINFNLLFPHIKIKYDKHDVGYKRSISAYINNLVQGQKIILLINRKYLESEYCMGEFVDILDHSGENLPDLQQRIYPIITESACCLYKPEQMVPVKDYWREKKEAIANAIKLDSDPELDEKKNKIDRIIKGMPLFVKIINDCYTLPLKVCQESKFFDLFWEINKQLTEDGFVSFYNDEEEMKKALGLPATEIGL